MTRTKRLSVLGLAGAAGCAGGGGGASTAAAFFGGAGAGSGAFWASDGWVVEVGAAEATGAGVDVFLESLITRRLRSKSNFDVFREIGYNIFNTHKTTRSYVWWPKP